MSPASDVDLCEVSLCSHFGPFGFNAVFSSGVALLQRCVHSAAAMARRGANTPPSTPLPCTSLQAGTPQHHKFKRCHLDLRVGLSKSKFNGFQWISMDFNGFPLISVDFHGFPWISGKPLPALLRELCFAEVCTFRQPEVIFLLTKCKDRARRDYNARNRMLTTHATRCCTDRLAWYLYHT